MAELPIPPLPEAPILDIPEPPEDDDGIGGGNKAKKAAKKAKKVAAKKAAKKEARKKAMKKARKMYRGITILGRGNGKGKGVKKPHDDCQCINNEDGQHCYRDDKVTTLDDFTVVRYCNGPKQNLTIGMGVNKPR